MITIQGETDFNVITSDWQSIYEQKRLQQGPIRHMLPVAIAETITHWFKASRRNVKRWTRRAVDTCSFAWGGRYQVTSYDESFDRFVIKRAGGQDTGQAIPCFVRRTYRITKTWDRLTRTVHRQQRELISDEVIKPPL